MAKLNVLMLLAFIMAAELAGVVGMIFTTPNISTWYATLAKPEFAPPNWVFGPVWISLYLLMGIAAYLVAQEGIDKKEERFALTIFGFQLAINAIWSFAFFGLQSPLFGLMVIVLLWFSIVETILLFAKISKKAAWLLVPYLLWVTLAAFLNLEILLMNP